MNGVSAAALTSTRWIISVAVPLVDARTHASALLRASALDALVRLRNKSFESRELRAAQRSELLSRKRIGSANRIPRCAARLRGVIVRRGLVRRIAKRRLHFFELRVGNGFVEFLVVGN